MSEGLELRVPSRPNDGDAPAAVHDAPLASEHVHEGACERVHDDSRGLRRAVGFGALAWALLAALYVALHPLVVDETVLSAQILNGAVSYPAGHPHAVFHLQAFSLPNQLSAALLRLTGDVELVSRSRNFLVIFLTAFAPFLVATLVSRRALVGCAAAAIALADGFQRFQGVYPTFVFPTFYSHGHVGLLGALVTVALVCGGFRRTGALLLGLFPAIHPLLGALVWLWALVWLTCAEERPRGRGRRAFLLFLVLGLAISAVSFALSRASAPTEPPLALYAPGDAAQSELVRQGFLEFTDPHRHMPPSDAGTFRFGYAANTAAFVALAVLLAVARAGRGRAAARWIAWLGVLAWAVVWGARALELALGHMPDALNTAMPYRLSNVSAMLLAPLGVAALVRTAEGAGRAALGVASAALIVLVLAGGAANHMALADPDAARYGMAAGIGALGCAFAAGVVASPALVARAACLLASIVLAAIFLEQRARSGFQGAELLIAAFAVTALLLALVRRMEAARARRTAQDSSRSSRFVWEAADDESDADERGAALRDTTSSAGAAQGSLAVPGRGAPTAGGAHAAMQGSETARRPQARTDARPSTVGSEDASGPLHRATHPRDALESASANASTGKLEAASGPLHRGSHPAELESSSGRPMRGTNAATEFEVERGPLPLRGVLALACVAAVVAAGRRADPEPSSLVSAFDRELVSWLDANTEPDALLLVPLQPRTQLQAKTGHPVLLELGTLWLMPYLPSLSSAIGRMTADLYGVDYSDRAALERLAPDGYLGQHDAAWSDVWRHRTRAAWCELAAQYDFALVVAPTEWTIDLVPLIVSVEWTLYRVPGA